MKLKRIWQLFLPVIFLLLIDIASLKAQGLPCGDPDVDCPIDGSVIVLAAAILFLSVKKLWNRPEKVDLETGNFNHD